MPKTPLISFFPAILVVLIPIYILAASLIVSALDYQDSDFFTFWLAGRLIASGSSPYDSTNWVGGHHQYGADWIPNPIFPYPLPLSLLAVPIGLLPLRIAYITWISLSLILITLAIFLSLDWRPSAKNRFLILPLLLGALLLRPTLVALRNGQLGAFLLILLILTLYLWNRGKWSAGAFVVAFLMLKPTVGLPIIGFLALYLLVKKKFSAIFTLSITILGLASLGFIVDSHWISKFFSVGSAKFGETFGYNPTVWGLSGFICRQEYICTIGLGGVLSLGMALLLSWFIIKRGGQYDPWLIASLIIPVSLLITPYLWAYDQILLLTGIFAAVLLISENNSPYIVTASFPILISLFSLILLYIANRIGHDAFSTLLPIVILIAVWWQKRDGQQFSNH